MSRICGKKPEYRVAENNLRDELTQFVGVKGLRKVRLVKRYDVEGVSFAIFSQAVRTVLCEVVVDDWYPEMPDPQDAVLFAVESLPGQFDQRSDSAASCIQLMSQGSVLWFEAPCCTICTATFPRTI